jgi:nucleotide-binding universal stress UspA family protein
MRAGLFLASTADMESTATLDAPVPERTRALDFQSILAVVEFDRHARELLSPASRSVLRLADGLAAPHGGRVTVLHVLPPLPRAVVVPGAPSRDSTSAIGRALARLTRALDIERPAARVEAHVTSGHALDEIERAAADASAGLIVAGYQDRPGAYADGFSFRALLHRASCPVLVARASTAGWEP